MATDLQQSILAEMDRSGPNRLAYTPYGSQSGTLAAGTRLGFNGQLRERPAGWYHLGNGYRAYNPVLMRFHSPDRLSPFGEGGVNAYAYCSGDPLNYTDPTGQFPFAVISVIQRSLLVTLHSVIPAAMIMGPKVSGVALHATRFSLVGSIGTAVGAGMTLMGSAWGPTVTMIGTAGLLAGAGTRGAVAVKTAYAKNELWKTVKGNVMNIFGWSDSPKVVKPPVPTAPATPQAPRVSIINMPASGNDSLRTDAAQIRRQSASV